MLAWQVRDFSFLPCGACASSRSRYDEARDGFIPALPRRTPLNNSASSVVDRAQGSRLPGPRLHGLDTLRSLAIVAVIVFHYWGYGGEGALPDWFVPIAKLGWMGVDLFFVLSGYLIGSQLLRPYTAGKRAGLWQFYRNRIYRILPVYFAVLAAYYFIPNWPEFDGLAPLWQYLTFTFNLFVDYEKYQTFSHVWSLCVEEHFYLLLPLIVIAMMRKPSMRKAVALVVGILLFGMAIRGFLLVHMLRPAFASGDSFGALYMERIYYPTYSRLDGLLIGVVLAAIRIFRPAWWQAIARRGHLLTLSGIACIGIAIWLFKDRFTSDTGVAALGTVIGFPVLALGLGLMTASALSENGVLSRWHVPGAKLIATLAYALYLTSKELIHIVDLCFPHLAQTSMAGRLAVYAVFCLVVAGALHLCVERPFLLLRDRQKQARA